jgi:hypothetical protein
MTGLHRHIPNIHDGVVPFKAVAWTPNNMIGVWFPGETCILRVENFVFSRHVTTCLSQDARATFRNTLKGHGTLHACSAASLLAKIQYVFTKRHLFSCGAVVASMR